MKINGEEVISYADALQVTVIAMALQKIEDKPLVQHELESFLIAHCRNNNISLKKCMASLKAHWLKSHQ